MRLMWMALFCAALGLGGRTSAVAATLGLQDCRLEHPLRINSAAARCGVFRVAEDPSSPSGGAIDLHVAVVPALNRRSEGPPLFILAGGPGQAATDLYTSYAGAFARVNRNHAIVLLDQRGTGHSSPLDCSYPDDWQETADDLTKLRQATHDCLAKYGERVRFYTTSVAVDDLERVRAALGYAVIDLYGSSYGTRVAQLYMRRHPESIQAVVLDGVTYPEQAIGPDTPLDGERALQLIVARCEQADGCRNAFPELRTDLTALRRRFGPESVRLSVPDPDSGQPLAIEFNRSVLNAALRYLSYSSTQASLLPTLIQAGAHGDLAPMALQSVMMSRQISGQLASGMQNSVVCSEDEPLFATLADRRPLIESTYQGSEQLLDVAAICKEWPRGPVDAQLHAVLHSDIPTLLLSGEADPVTPPDDADRAARFLTHHRSLVLAGEGHGQVAIACVPRLIAAFLDNPVPEALDERCLATHRPAPFFVGLTGPVAMIQATSLNKRFGEIEAVSDVSFAARDGEITGLLGPNGAGKSTCLRMIYGVLTPDGGEARIDGIDIRGETSTARARLGVLPHAAGLYNHLTARENIAYFGALQGLKPDALRRQCADLGRSLGMEGFMDRPVRGFSQGQRIKVALARALVHDPGNLVLDEPTNGLDVMAIRSLRDMLQALRAQGRCILFSSHVMQEVAVLCDRVVIIGRGRVLAEGTPQAIREASAAATLEQAFMDVLDKSAELG